MDEQNGDVAILKGTKVLLFFISHHDEKNTIDSEVKKIEAFRARVQNKCICVDYNNNQVFEQSLGAELLLN